MNEKVENFIFMFMIVGLIYQEINYNILKGKARPAFTFYFFQFYDRIWIWFYDSLRWHYCDHRDTMKSWDVLMWVQEHPYGILYLGWVAYGYNFNKWHIASFYNSRIVVLFHMVDRFEVYLNLFLASGPYCIPIVESYLTQSRELLFEYSWVLKMWNPGFKCSVGGLFLFLFLIKIYYF